MPPSAAAILSRALGRRVIHVRILEEEAWRWWKEGDCSSSVADAFVERYRTMEKGTLAAGMQRTPVTTTPTSLEESGRILLRPLPGNRMAS